jgi:putative ABC transport system permease protein
MRRTPMLEFRDAVRALRSTPVLTATAVLSLALGIGATTAIFSLLNGLLLKSLPVHDPAGLAVLATNTSEEGESFPLAVWQTGRDMGAFPNAFAWTRDRVDLAPRGRSQFVDAIWASGAIFETLGVRPQFGRLFSTADDRPTGGPDGPVVVVSDRFWRSRFQGASRMIGDTLLIERVPFRIIGVTPRDFFGVEVGLTFDVMMPLATERLLGRPFDPWIDIMMRLGSHETLAGASARLASAQPRLRELTMPPYVRPEDRAHYLSERWVAATAVGGVSTFRVRYVPALRLLFATALVVVLIACANLAMLMLARSVGRQFEFSVRRALGASTIRLARQVLTESTMLSVAGTAAGFVFAHWGANALTQQLTTWVYRVSLDLSPDWRVFSIAAVSCAGCTLLFGAVPAVIAARSHPRAALAGGAPAVVGRFRAGDILVFGQLALSTVLIVAAGLFVRSFFAVAHRDLGFDRDVQIAVVDLRHAPSGADERLDFFNRLRDAVSSVPGIDASGLSLATPIGPSGVRLAAQLDIPGLGAVRVMATPISPGWLTAYRTPLIAGRDFTNRDRRGAAPVAIVNETFVRRYLGSRDPVGHTVVGTAGSGVPAPIEIIGVVKDAAFASARAPLDPLLYFPIDQSFDALRRIPSVSVSFRARPGILASERAIAEALATVAPDASVTFQRLRDQLNVFYIRERLLATVTGFLGGLGLLLAAVGLYGVTAYAVSRRRREIGVRMALGADARRVRRMFLARMVTISAAGVAVGCLLSYWLARFVGALLYGIPPRDGSVFSVAAGVLLAAAAVAAWVPAERAARSNPSVLLRES